MWTRVLCVASLAICACGEPESANNGTNNVTVQPTNNTTAVSDDWVWALPDGFPLPAIPEDNPMSVSKVELGRHLFYDTRLSGNETQSCGSCHRQAIAFTDALPVSEGSTGEFTPRGSMALANVAYNATYTWANPILRTLEDQMLTPLFGEFPPELGLTSQEQMLERLRDDDDYVQRFEAVFDAAGDGAEAVTLDRVTKAIAAFERALMSADSPFDRYRYGGDNDALTDQQKRGMDLFFSERLECFHCHGGFNFADSVTHEGTVFEEITFHNNGLYNIGGTGAYPAGNQGIFEISGLIEDTGRFRAPSLRNIALTAPYMHDGSLATLGEVVDHYARGGTNTEDGPHAGDGKFNPFKSSLVTGFVISAAEKADLLAFFEALTDETFISDPAFADPFEESP